MQLLHQRNVPSVKDFPMYQPDVQELDVKEKVSAASCRMNPVASGDNVTVLGSAHKLSDMPMLIPCCEGRELKIDGELVRTGLSAISVKHDSVPLSQSLSSACERLQVPPGLVKHRNSFRNLQRPDLKRVPYLRRMSPDELHSLFNSYADLPGLADRNDNQQVKSPEFSPPLNLDDGTLNPITETASDIPAGMRLRSARARLYTSVLAAATTGDQLDGTSLTEEYDAHVPSGLPEDEDLNEELQVILPPKTEDEQPSPASGRSE